jgi:hypothetical protein
MTDEYVLHKSMDESINATEFNVNSRQYVWVNDSNAGSYSSSQVQFDLTSIANSNRFVDWKSSYLAIPLTFAVQNTAGSAVFNGLHDAQFALSLKNNIMNVINSVSVVLNNNQVVDIQSFQNTLINAKMLQSFSTTDVLSIGDTLLFNPDTGASQTWCGTAGNTGVGFGLANNQISGASGNNINNFVPTNGLYLPNNSSRQKRMLATSFANDASMNSTPLPSNAWSAGNTVLLNSAQLGNIGKFYVASNTTSQIAYTGVAKLPMRFIHDLFERMPLAKNMYIRLVVNTHLVSSCVIPYNASAQITGFTPSTPFGVFPLQVSPLSTSVGTGLQITGGAGGSLLVRSTIGSTLPAVGGAGAISVSNPITACRLYASLIEFTPLYESLYLKNPVRQIEYFDNMTFNNIQNIASNGTYNGILTPSLAKLRRLWLFPIMNGIANGTTTSPYEPANSPFSSEPATCSPYAFTTNLQVFLSGIPLYNEPKTYSFMNFLEETRGAGSINGGLQSGLVSGLLSEMDYNTTYGIVSVDLSRHSPEQDAIAKSVMVSFTNSSAYAMNYYAVIEYAKVMNLNIETGTLVV